MQKISRGQLRRWLLHAPTDPRLITNDTERRVARITGLAVSVFRSQAKAARWLNRPRNEFAGASPLEMLETPAGTRQVEIMLAAVGEEPEP